MGKTGVSAAFIDQLNRQLKLSKLVKAKAQKNSLDSQEMDEISKSVASATGSILVDVRGRTFTLWLDDRKTEKPAGKQARARAVGTRARTY